MLKKLKTARPKRAIIIMAIHSLLLAEELCSNIRNDIKRRLIDLGTKEWLLGRGSSLEDFFLEITVDDL